MSSGYTAEPIDEDLFLAQSESQPDAQAARAQKQQAAQDALAAENKKKKKEARIEKLKEVGEIMGGVSGAGGGSSDDDAGLLGESTARAHRESLYGPWEKRKA